MKDIFKVSGVMLSVMFVVYFVVAMLLATPYLAIALICLDALIRFNEAFVDGGPYLLACMDAIRYGIEMLKGVVMFI